MDIVEFERELNKKAKTEGASYKKVDMHIHSPTASDHEYKESDKIKKLGEAINENQLDIAVILDHCQAPEKSVLNEISSYSKNTLFLPGAELNVYVDVMSKKVSKDHFFHCLLITNPDSERDYNYLVHRAKDKFKTREDSNNWGFTSNICEIGKFFQEENALFIPAHLHQSKDPEQSRSIDDIYDDEAFLSFVADGAFSALEVRDKKTASFFDGTKSSEEGILIPSATCIRSSDSHSYLHLNERNKYTYVKMENSSFDELKAALFFPSRIKLDLDNTEIGKVIGIHIVGQFIKDEWVLFNPSLNSLIGCKGSGKTSILECLRFVLGTYLPDDKKDSIKKHVDHILGSSGYVECLVCNRNGDKYLLTRRADSPKRLKYTDNSGVTLDINDITEIQFEASILGWHEIEAVAEHPKSRINLIDSIGDEKEILIYYESINKNVENARDRLPNFQRKVKNFKDTIDQRNDLRKKRSTLQKLEAGDLLSLQNQYEYYLNCEQRLQSLFTRIQKASRISISHINSVFGTIIDEFGDANDYPTDIRDIIIKAKSTFTDLNSTRDQGKEIFNKKFEEVGKNIELDLKKAKDAFLSFRINTYDPKVNQLPPEDREILSRQIQIIEETKLLPDVEHTCNTIVSEIRTIGKTIYDFCDEICKTRENICLIRTNIIDDINNTISSIKLNFLKSANRSIRKRYQQNYGQDANSFFSLVDQHAGGEYYEKLRSLFHSYANLDVESTSFGLQDLIWDSRFVDFLKVLDDDDIQISLVLPNGSVSSIQNLSAGQRCTAVFPLLLRISKGPLIIDQPEDNLDNRHIADDISPQLLVKKDKQQFIITSHNANLVVLTDSDLILQTDSDGSTGWIEKRGYFSCYKSDIKKSVLDVLDGGEKALLARQKKYGLDND